MFCNPPYGPGIGQFLSRAHEARLAVFLIPARTDTRWFHDIVIPKAREIRFLRGRLKFGGSKNNAPFPSMVVIFEDRRNKPDESMAQLGAADEIAEETLEYHSGQRSMDLGPKREANEKEK